MKLITTLFILLLAFTIFPKIAQAQQVELPTQFEWQYQGVVINSGSTGEWDVRLSGMITPCAVVKKDNTYFLYYLGADGNRTEAYNNDGGPRHRALGVATSTDGINFTKYNSNPILTHLINWVGEPYNDYNNEEGIFSCGGNLDTQGNVVIYYGGMEASRPTSGSVDGDGLVAVSFDGYHFTELGDVLSHSDSSVWGYGDELFPDAAYHYNNKWYMYYIAKGGGVSWDIGLAEYENDMTTRISTQPVVTNSDYAGAGIVSLDDQTKALFIRNRVSSNVQVFTFNINEPSNLGSVVEAYDFGDDGTSVTVYLDKDLDKWFLYRINKVDNGIDLFTANVVYNSSTPTPVPDSVITSLSVSSGKDYQIQTNLQIGDTIYIDRAYSYDASLPTYLLGANYIQTANDDKTATGDPFLSFDLTQDATVYIAHDARITSKPSWLTSDFADTGETILVDGVDHNLYSQIYVPGAVSLGDNSTQSTETGMYTVIVVPKEAPATCRPGDTSRPCDDDIDIFDYNTLLQEFGQPPPHTADFSAPLDGDVDIFDYNILLTNFGG